MSEHAIDMMALGEKIQERSAFIDDIRRELDKVVIGQKYMIDRLMIGLLTNGHVLLEGVPGLAKTLTISSLATVIDTDFQRIQFTPDLLPADLIGTLIYNQKEGDFFVKKGPIFANIILADEINRSPAKVQSALLEAMQEKQVTIGEESFKLQEPFLVLATQNPVEQEGTYPLPESQLDRFTMTLSMGYPDAISERALYATKAQGRKPVAHEIGRINLLDWQHRVQQIHCSDELINYLHRLVDATRASDDLWLGLSPRAGLQWLSTARAWAFIHDRDFVLPDDLQDVAMPVIRHRCIARHNNEESATEILNQILQNTGV